MTTTRKREIQLQVISEAEASLFDKEYPIERSMSGDNSLYHFCETFNARSNYAVCLHTILAARRCDPDQEALRPMCYDAIKARQCPAIEMRREEIEAKRALYYLSRNEITAIREREAAETAPEHRIMYGKLRGGLEGLKGTHGGQIDFSRYEASVAENERGARNEPVAARTPAPIKSKRDANTGLDVDAINTGSLGEAINTVMEEYER
jgi:hypothetical protein